MAAPAAKEHTARAQKIHNFARASPATKERYDEFLQGFLVKLEERCNEGVCEELEDVALLQRGGKGSHGLDLWARLRGSMRAELMRQKVQMPCGPWGTGAAVGHFLLLLVLCHFNASAAIHRCNARSFGHPWRHFVGRAHTRNQETFGVDVCP